jgi:CRISPR-associated protein (TIGR03985 family)/CRISPR-associated protein (TIGR02710 family)
MSQILFITVGGSHQPVVTAIETLQPNRAIFICSIGKRGSESQIVGQDKPCEVRRGQEVIERLPNIPTQAGLGERFNPDTDLIRLDDPDDFAENYSKIVQVIQQIQQEEPTAQLLADYTGGTKTMSVSLALAALDYRLTLYLTSGNRTDLLRVSRGEMTGKTAIAPVIVQRTLDQFLPTLLQQSNYTGAIAELRRLLSDLVIPTANRRQVQDLYTCCQAFDAWDRFDHLEAWELLSPYMRIKMIQPLGLFLRKVLNSRASIDPDFQTSEGTAGHGYEVVEDLLLNAERRATQHRYDDAVGRLYRAFSPHHPRQEKLSAEEIITQCSDSRCLCHRSFRSLLTGIESEADWLEGVHHLTGLRKSEIKYQLSQRPFATVHRTLRDDLKHLTQQGWLNNPQGARYQCCLADQLPSAPNLTQSDPVALSNISLSPSQTWEILRVLESVSFVQPNLEFLIESLWEQVAPTTPSSKGFGEEHSQRIFIHLDYILPDEVQDRVDTYQQQLERLWQQRGGVIEFDYWVASQERQVQVRVYPVCLHYVRRAKYLSAYGKDPYGNFGWHNYRLDRIRSEQLKVLAWGDPAVPRDLKELWRAGRLPTPEVVQAELDAAWGFNFYLPRELLIISFPPKFARWYVDQTVRHPTFEPVTPQELPDVVPEAIKDPAEQEQILNIIASHHPELVYYRGWIRVGDINVLMRLRDWRPNGEVIAPLSLRQTLIKEATEELTRYRP